MAHTASPDLSGCLCPPRFEAVRKAFLDNFAGDLPELGARFTAAVEGEIVLDLWGGYADRARAVPFDQTTLAPVFSTSKAVASLMLAWRIAHGVLAYGQRATHRSP